MLKHAAKRRREFSIDVQDIETKIKTGFCEVTGIPFDLRAPAKFEQNPYAPSLDRISGDAAYVKGNVRTVCLLYNCARNSHGDDALKLMLSSLPETSPP